MEMTQELLQNLYFSWWHISYTKKNSSASLMLKITAWTLCYQGADKKCPEAVIIVGRLNWFLTRIEWNNGINLMVHQFLCQQKKQGIW